MPTATEVSASSEVGIVGAGPIGLELAVALKRAGIPYLHFDAKQIGYTISWFAPQTRFFSSNERIAIAGVPLQTPDQSKSTREQYLAYLRGVVEQFDLQIRTYEPVVGIERLARRAGFVLTTRPAAGTQTYRVRQLVLATGGTDRPRRLGVPGEDLPHVSHYFDDPHRYFRRKVLIIGGKNSAVEAALRCHNAGAHVSLSYRREKLPARSIKYWLLPEINGLMQAGRIRGYFQTVAAEITPSSVRLASVRSQHSLFPVEDGEACNRLSESEGDDARAHGNGRHRQDTSDAPGIDVAADFVLPLIGYEQDNTLFKLAGVEVRGSCQSPIYDSRTMETNVPRLYVAGTSVGGTQDKYSLFIENCHVHVDRILAALTGATAPLEPEPIARPES